MGANIGKPVTRIRQEIAIPQGKVLAPQGFKVLPVTPRVAKSPGWRLGSGFDGITFKPSTNKSTQTSRNRKAKPLRMPSSLSRSLPTLDLRVGLSPIHQSIDQRGIPKRQSSQGRSVETKRYKPASELGGVDGAFEDVMQHRVARSGEKTTFEQVADLTLTHLLGPSINDWPSTKSDQSLAAPSFQRKSVVKEPVQMPQSQTRNLSSLAIREPSKSERNGWLKRRRVHFAVSDESENEEKPFFHTQRACANFSEASKRNGRACLDTYLEDTSQEQRAVYRNLQATKGRGKQTSPSPDQPGHCGQQSIFQREQSARENQHRAWYDTERQPFNSEDEIFEHQSSICPPKPPPSSDSEADFPNSRLHAKGLSMPSASHHLEIPRTYDVSESPERLQESIELDRTRTKSPDLGQSQYHISKITPDAGKSSPGAFQRFDSPDEAPHTVARRRPRRQPNADVRDSQVMLGMQKGTHRVNVAPVTGEQKFRKREGDLKLGMTQRIKRRMSNVPFRPPFKEPL